MTPVTAGRDGDGVPTIPNATRIAHALSEVIQMTIVFMRSGVLCISCVMLALVGCKDSGEHGTSDQVVTQHQLRRGASSLKYGYGGQFGIYDIADTASAYNGSTLLAQAKAIRIIEKHPGPNQIEVEETHYSPAGVVTYQGKLRIRFGFGGGYLEEEIPISGRKQASYFTGWPSGS